MIAKTFSATVLGIDDHLIEVEVDISVSISVFKLVELSDGTIKESRDRILSAVNTSDYSFNIWSVALKLVSSPYNSYLGAV